MPLWYIDESNSWIEPYTLRKPGSNIRVVFRIILFWSFKGHFWSNFRINIYKWIKFTRIIFDLISGSKFWSVFLDHFGPGRMSSYLILCSDQKWSFLSHIWSWLSKSDSRKCIHTIISPDLPTASRGRVVRAMVS